MLWDTNVSIIWDGSLNLTQAFICYSVGRCTYRAERQDVGFFSWYVSLLHLSLQTACTLELIHNVIGEISGLDKSDLTIQSCVLTLWGKSLTGIHWTHFHVLLINGASLIIILHILCSSGKAHSCSSSPFLPVTNLPILVYVPDYPINC